MADVALKRRAVPSTKLHYHGARKVSFCSSGSGSYPEAVSIEMRWAEPRLSENTMKGVAEKCSCEGASCKVCSNHMLTGGHTLLSTERPKPPITHSIGE